ncbi:hypothetical protein V6N12_010109 [Hibiscus sabdariffa]|uniref:Uncharacterized protein n=1 Tax=Hibiscus sabdariffa TaxID=183260 RepID=A0ABR2ECQ4_9ROSI
MCKCRSHGTFPLFGLQSSHLNICYYHQDLHRRPLRPGSRPRFYGDRRALLLIGAWPLPRRSGIGHALKRHPFSGLVDSAVSLRASTRVSSGFAPLRHSSPSFGSRQACSHSNPSQKIKTPWSVFQDGPNGEPAGRRPEHAGAEARRDGACWVPRSRRRRLHGRIEGPGLGRHHNPRRATPRADRRTGSRRSTSDRGASPAPIRFPPDNFKHSLTLFSKSFSSFPRGSGHDGALTLSGAPFQGLGPGPPLRTLLQTTIRTPRANDSQAGLFPVRSPLLRESFTVLAVPKGSESTDRRKHTTRNEAARSNTTDRRGTVVAEDSILGKPRATCPRPNGLGRNLRSKTRWFTGFYNSHQVSHFATFFIDARAEISVAESRFVYSRQSGHVSAARAPRTGVQQQTATFSFRFLGVIHAGGCSFCHGDTGSRVTGTGRGRGAMKRPHPLPLMFDNTFTGRSARQVSTMILPQVHLRKPCYDFSFL